MKRFIAESEEFAVLVSVGVGDVVLQLSNMEITLLERYLDHVPDGDHADDLVIHHHREVAEASCGHQLQAIFGTLVWLDIGDVGSHHVLDLDLGGVQMLQPT